MRTQTYSGVKVTYPDYLIYRGDDNYVRAQKLLHLENNSEVMLRITIGGETLECDTPTGDVYINIYSLLRKVNASGVVTATFYIATTDPVYSTSFTDTFYVANGWTMADRAHGSGHPVYVSEGWKVDVLCLDACSVIYGEDFDVIASAQIVQVDTAGWTAERIIEVRYSGGSELFEVRFIKCLPADGALFRWIDSDGCERYMAGRIISRSYTSQSDEYPKALTSEPARNIHGRLASIEVGFEQIGKAVRFEEIVFSPEIHVTEADGTEYNVVPAFDSVRMPSKGENDMILTFKTMI